MKAIPKFLNMKAIPKFLNMFASSEVSPQSTERNACELDFAADFNARQSKLRSSKGETLVETLAAILIAALSVALLFTCIMASVRLNKNAKEVDRDYYEAFSNAELRTTKLEVTPAVVISDVSVSPTVTVTVTVTVDLYGGKGVYSY